MSHDHCIICQCEHGMQLSLQLLTSKKQVVKAITGHISCIRNICVYRYSCCIGGHSNGRKYVTLRELRSQNESLYTETHTHTPFLDLNPLLQAIPESTPIQFSRAQPPLRFSWPSPPAPPQSSDWSLSSTRLWGLS